MTKRELEKIGRALLPELAGFAVKGSLVFMCPIGHTLRAVFFDRSIDPRGFYAQVFLQPLCVPVTYLFFNLGWRLGGDCHLWQADAPRLLAELGSALRREALPFLTRIRTPADTARAAGMLHKSADLAVREAIAYSWARAGDVRKATKALDELVALLRHSHQYPWQLEMAQRAEGLKTQLLTRPLDAQHQLDAWERGTLDALGLTEFQ